MTIKTILTSITDKIKNISDNKLAPFSYEQSAYDNDTVEGTDTYDFSKEQNIPIANADVLQVNPTILSKGFRSQVASLPRMLLNHFFGRTSYNLNKISDYLLSFSAAIAEALGNTDGIATLDEDKKLVKSQFPYQVDVDIPFLNSQRKLKKEHIPHGVLLFNGFYNAQTNEPTLVNGTGVTGSAYCVSVEGRQSFGGDYTYNLKQNTFIIYNGEKWTPLAVGGNNVTGVTSVNGIGADVSGNVTISIPSDLGRKDELGNVFIGDLTLDDIPQSVKEGDTIFEPDVSGFNSTFGDTSGYDVTGEAVANEDSMTKDNYPYFYSGRVKIPIKQKIYNAVIGKFGSWLIDDTKYIDIKRGALLNAQNNLEAIRFKTLVSTKWQELGFTENIANTITFTLYEVR